MDEVYTWLNITLGTPPQAFRLLVRPQQSNMYVFGVNADGLTPTITNRTYNATASSTYTAVNANFTPTPYYSNGTVGSDVLGAGPDLQSNVTFELVNRVSVSGLDVGFDGVFGLSALPDDNTGTSLLGQLQRSLDSPVYTLQMNRNTLQGQLTLGGLAPDQCKAESWTQVERPLDWGPTWAGYGMPIFNVSGLTIANCDSGSECSVSVNMSVYFSRHWPYIDTTPEVLALFVQASNATYNASSDLYELTAQQVGAAQTVYLQLPSGGQIRMGPHDYIGLSEASHSNFSIYSVSFSGLCLLVGSGWQALPCCQRQRLYLRHRDDPARHELPEQPLRVE